MPPTPTNPSDLPTDIPKTTLLLAHFANLKLSGDRVVHDTVDTITTLTTRSTPQPPRHAPRQRRRRVRHNRSTRVHKMSDADLEAELAARRASRQRERERYAKAIRSEKLSALENELSRLRSELTRMDRTGGVGAGTPPTARWEALPGRRNRSSALGHSSAVVSAPPAPGAPPPPLPPMGGDDVVVDPEQRRREKEERQRRREAKRKEREANRKPLTLADIIKGAGPDPMARLRPPGSIPVPDVYAPEEDRNTAEDLKGAKEGLKKVSREEEDGKEVSKEQTTGNDDAKEDEKEDTMAEGNEDGMKEGEDKQNKEEQENEKKEEDEAKEETQDEESNVAAEDAKASETEKKEAEASNGKDEANVEDSADSSQRAGTPDIDTPQDSASQAPTTLSSTVSLLNKSPPPETAAISPDEPEKKDEIASSASPALQPEASVTNSAADPANDSAANGTVNGMDALAALSQLKAKLPTAPSGDAEQAKAVERPERKRISIEEKRRLRRAAKEKVNGDGQGKGDLKIE